MVSKLQFSCSFHLIDENEWIIVVIIIMTKVNLIQLMPILV